MMIAQEQLDGLRLETVYFVDGVVVGDVVQSVGALREHLIWFSSAT